MKTRRFLPLLLFCALIPARAQSDSRVASILGDLRATQQFEEVAISPDGARVAWVEPRDAGSAIFVRARAPGSAPVRITAGQTDCSEGDIAYSPDGRRLAFLSNAERGTQMQLYVAPAAGGRALRLTSLNGYLTDPRWSPDGSRIALLFAENAPGGGGPLEAVPVQTGVIDSAIYNQRLAVVDVASHAVRQISPASLHVYEYDWSPDGRRFVFTAAPGPGDNNWWIAQLYTQPTPAGEPRVLYRPKWQIAMPRWSPDGATVAFIEGLMSDAGFTGGDVFTIPAEGGEAVKRTPGRKSSPSSVQWLSASRLLLTETAGGGTLISTLDLPGGTTTRVWQGGEQIHSGGNFPNFSLAANGRDSAVIRSDFQHPPEVWAGPIGEWKPMTEANRGRRPEWGEAKSLEWTNDGFNVQGWLLYPRHYDPARRYPMVVEVHGGPANATRPRWPSDRFEATVLSALGYFVLFPNPRGSYGQGEAFTQANIKDFGGGDLRDILAGVDAVLQSAPVDPARIGITGWSYGGYMTMWAVTQTNRFKAAVAGAGLANWQSYYGENSIDRWMIPYFGASVYDDPAVYAKSSPISFIRNAHTPTLVVVGERDGECPAPQSYEFWHALKTFRVPTQLVVYAGEGHMFRDPAHKRDVMERALRWFEQYLR